jgi:hypothetical protein
MLNYVVFFSTQKLILQSLFSVVAHVMYHTVSLNISCKTKLWCNFGLMFKHRCDDNFCFGFGLCVIKHEGAEMQTVSFIVFKKPTNAH